MYRTWCLGGTDTWQGVDDALSAVRVTALSAAVWDVASTRGDRTDGIDYGAVVRSKGSGTMPVGSRCCRTMKQP